MRRKPVEITSLEISPFQNPPQKKNTPENIGRTPRINRTRKRLLRAKISASINNYDRDRSSLIIILLKSARDDRLAAGEHNARSYASLTLCETVSAIAVRTQTIIIKSSLVTCYISTLYVLAVAACARV